MIPLSKNLRISVFTASCIIGLSLRCGSFLGVASSFKYIRSYTIAGLIPLMSLMVHPIASFSFLKTDINLSSCSPVKWDAIMIERVLFSPKYAYLRCSSKAFNSKGGTHRRSLQIQFQELTQWDSMPNLQQNQ